MGIMNCTELRQHISTEQQINFRNLNKTDFCFFRLSYPCEIELEYIQPEENCENFLNIFINLNGSVYESGRLCLESDCFKFSNRLKISEFYIGIESSGNTKEGGLLKWKCLRPENNLSSIFWTDLNLTAGNDELDINRTDCSSLSSTYLYTNDGRMADNLTVSD